MTMNILAQNIDLHHDETEDEGKESDTINTERIKE